MADPKGFLTTPGRTGRAALSRSGSMTGPRSTSRGAPADHRGAGRPLHGLRRPVLSRGVSAREPDPGVERTRVAGRLAGGERPAARHEQLSRVHRAPVPRPVRGGLCPGDQPAGRDHQERGGRHRRPRLAGRPRPAQAARPAVRRHGRRGRLRPGGARGRPAAHPRGAHGGGLRAGRPAGRPDALRHPLFQDGEAPSGPQARAVEGGGGAFSYVDGGRSRHRRGRAAGALRRGGPRGRCHGLA